MYIIDLELISGNLDFFHSLRQGDAGGPLVCKGYNGKWLHIGTASYVQNG